MLKGVFKTAEKKSQSCVMLSESSLLRECLRKTPSTKSLSCSLVIFMRISDGNQKKILSREGIECLTAERQRLYCISAPPNIKIAVLCYVLLIFLHTILYSMEEPKDKFKLSEKQLKLSKISLLAGTSALLLLSALTIGYLSKNLTYTSRFTPPSMLSLLASNSIYSYSQVFILVANVLFIASAGLQCYSAFKLKSKIFKIFLTVNLLMWATCLACSLMFLCGGWGFQGELKKQYILMQSNPSACPSTFCSAADCGRLNSYKSTVNMQIAYCVIVSLVGAIMFPLAYMVNFNRIQNLESLEK